MSFRSKVSWSYAGKVKVSVPVEYSVLAESVV